MRETVLPEVWTVKDWSGKTSIRYDRYTKAFGVVRLGIDAVGDWKDKWIVQVKQNQCGYNAYGNAFLLSGGSMTAVATALLTFKVGTEENQREWCIVICDAMLKNLAGLTEESR